jgi:hypothetical protein
MTTEKKTQRLNNNGWNLVFNKISFNHEATRGFCKIKASNITELYRIIKNGFD